MTIADGQPTGGEIMRKLGLLVLFCAFWSPVLAGPAALMGYGTHTCARYARQVQTPNGERVRLEYFVWAQGFMAGLNGAVMHANPADLAKLDIEDQMGFIDLYCDRHPLSVYMASVLNLYDLMREKQQLPNWRTIVGRPD